MNILVQVYNVGFPYFGNGLMYAFEPWSNSYSVNSPIWTSAHTCQFTQPGWSTLLVSGGGSGNLTGGGSYVTYVAPDGNVTIVVEKLQGDCLRCSGEVTATEQVTFVLAGGLQRVRRMQLWSTNVTHEFVRLPDVTVSSNNAVSIMAHPDTIYTLSSWYNGQSKGNASIPASAPFPLPYSENFESYAIDDLAKYFADDGGSFQVALSPDGDAKRGKVYKQWVQREAGVNRWGTNTDPISYIGSPAWTSIEIKVDVRLGPSMPGPAPPPPANNFVFFQSAANNECLDVVGESRSAGGTIDTYPCVQQDNELFQYNASTGNVVCREVCRGGL